MPFPRNLFFTLLIFFNLLSFSQTAAYVRGEEASSRYLIGVEESILLMSDHYVNDPDNINSVFGSAYQLLEMAKESILIANYIFDNDTITEILNRKAEEGVEVTVLYDRDRSKPYVEKLHPKISLFTRGKGDGHMHHKFIVIDHEYNWISSANFNRPEESNLAIVCCNRWLAAGLYEESYEINSNFHRSPKQIYPYSSIIDGQGIELCLLPHTEPNNPNSWRGQMNEIGKERLFKLINEARERIRVAMVVWTFKDTARALVDAAKRGVKVEIVAANVDDEIVHILNEAGISIRRVTTAPFHHKFMWVDTTLWTGSVNWSMNGFSRDDDNAVILYRLKPDQILMMEGAWQRLLKISN
jgi:phosphatidylserine/phosphatidylglycerophosphate/cardiolipin synthase-like enzyme